MPAVPNLPLVDLTRIERVTSRLSGVRSEPTELQIHGEVAAVTGFEPAATGIGSRYSSS